MFYEFIKKKKKIRKINLIIINLFLKYLFFFF